MSMLNDSQILRETKLSAPDSKGRSQLAFTLPSGRKITSTDWLVPAEIKGKVLIAWANAIRAEDDYDIQEREERDRLARVEKRAQELSSAVLTGEAARALPAPPSGLNDGLVGRSAATSPGSSSSASLEILPDEPQGLIETKLLALHTEHAKVVAQRDEILSRLASVEESIDQWSTVLRALRPSTGSTETPSDPPEISDEALEAQRRHSVGSDLDRIDRGADGGRARTPRAQRRRRVAREAGAHVGPPAGEAVQQSEGAVGALPGDGGDDRVAEGGAGSDARPEDRQDAGNGDETF